ncbi:MAG: protein kinase [Nitrospirae bacterium]|nr:protein kinase [Nitrospirota bacterium]
MIGTKIGRYEIQGLLGEGAMGMVYRGRDTIIDRVVAVKTVKISSVAKAGTTHERFYHEARIAGKLSHPNIAHIYDVGQDKGIHYLVFECVEGATLKSVISEGKFIPLPDKLRIITLIARTLHYAHQRGVIHRDIKPANIMLLPDLQVKVMDFGIATLSSVGDTRPDSCQPHRPGALTGTPSYMSPEQISGGSVDRLSDIYSLGVLSYEFLCGRKAFTATSLPMLMDRILNENPVPPHLVNPALNVQISEFIQNALHKDRHLRYKSCSDFADAIDYYLNQAEMESTQDVKAARGYDKKTIIESLQQKYNFFSDFTYEQMLKIFSISSKKTYSSGEIIFRENTIGNNLFVIIAGKVKITKVFEGNAEPTQLALLKTGDCFGEMAIMDSSARFATAIADTDCVMIAINEVILRVSEPQLCLKLYRNLATILSEKLKKSDTRMNELWMRIKQLST